MSYRTELHTELVNAGIFSKKNIGNDSKYTFLEKGYYDTNQVLDFLITGRPIALFGATTWEFAKAMKMTTQTVRNRVIRKASVILQKWYYNIELLTLFLLRNQG